MTHSTDNDNSPYLIDKIKHAYLSKSALQIVSGNSKDFYGREIKYDTLDVSTHRGIVNYQPSELMITVRAGTSLGEINRVLKHNNQKLAFEPPNFKDKSTIGGSIASGLSGSARPFLGAARDFILGTRIINGRGESLRFGGEVIKNVAGYDASRLMVGALGTLGVLLDVSIKVLPEPETDLTLIQSLDLNAALNVMTHLKRQAIPITGLAYYNHLLYIRLSGSKNAVNKFQKNLGGELLNQTNSHFSWSNLDNQTLDFFNTNSALWRISVKSNTPALKITGDCFYNWAGAERWIKTDISNNEIFKQAADAGGHATLFRDENRTNDVFQPLPEALYNLHKELKSSFDPHFILNPGKIYSDI